MVRGGRARGSMWKACHWWKVWRVTAVDASISSSIGDANDQWRSVPTEEGGSDV